ncbi:N-acetyl-D-Glu racemase DgcA [Roseospirillum parvum]|uniref:Dipeptide epimerase n=1 Tax=Roseospirillum parvum TaxID=83401 RepID=A0A1G7U848_9PROT|nr:N-acetyl-D-Glu racemase DgcA [Roseospirillum parvum]SDG43742.1 L-alanine-DL-glutamate epimerase [Roseospirillum parvum]
MRGTRLGVHPESWPIAGAFTISRGSKTSAEVVVAQVVDALGHRGWGECVPYPRYGESVPQVLAALAGLAETVAGGLTRQGLLDLLPAGAARNALDCALWDLEAKAKGVPVWRLAGLPEPRPLLTAQTISLDSPEKMAARAAELDDRALLKLKVGRDDALERIAAVHQAAPVADLIIDANEAWDLELLKTLAPQLPDLGAVLIEQPLPAEADQGLEGVHSPVPLCADESVHGADDLDHLAGRYQVVNIKLDKTGGLTAGLALRNAARARGFGVMVGCMVGTSLAMAPAALLAADADFVDLDGPLLLAADREAALLYERGRLYPPLGVLWG